MPTISGSRTAGLAEAVEACETRTRSGHLLTDTPFQGQSEKGPRKRDAESRESDGDATRDARRAGVHWLHPPAVDLANGNASRIWWIARDQFATYGSLSGAIGLAAQVIFAMFSVIQVWRR